MSRIVTIYPSFSGKIGVAVNGRHYNPGFFSRARLQRLLHPQKPNGISLGSNGPIVGYEVPKIKTPKSQLRLL